MQNEQTAPTFISSRGNSNIDEWREVNVINWTVQETEETLSDHKHILFEIEGKPQRNKTSKKKFDYHGTSWQRVTDGLLVASTEIRATMQIDEIEKQAEQMQAAFKKSTKLLKTTTIIIKQDNEWWDGERQQKKLELRRKADSIRREDGDKTDLVIPSLPME